MLRGKVIFCSITPRIEPTFKQYALKGQKLLAQGNALGNMEL